MSYTIQRGDTLWGIATRLQRQGVQGSVTSIIGDIERRNPKIHNPNLIFAGDTLELPGTPRSSPAPKPRPAPAQPGQPSTSGQIATRFPDRVAKLNLRQHYDGDCSMAVVANMLELSKGSTPGEQAVVDKAVGEGIGSTRTGMSPDGRERLLREYGLHPSTQYHATVNDLAKQLQAGRVVNVAVNPATLRNNNANSGGALTHVINVVGVKTDSSGQPASFTIVDTGQWPPGKRDVSAAVMRAATNNDSVLQSVEVANSAGARPAPKPAPKPAPAPAPGRAPAKGASQALAWARQFLGTGKYEDLCGSFCYQAYSKGAGRNLGPEWNQNTAGQIGATLQREGKLTRYDPNHPPPPGAILFYPPDSNNSHYGHVVLCTETPNQVISTGWPVPYTPVKTWNINALSAAEGVQPLGWYVP